MGADRSPEAAQGRCLPLRRASPGRRAASGRLRRLTTSRSGFRRQTPPTRRRERRRGVSLT
eukprot:4059546-Prymnesium_polylepis.1